MNKKPQVFLNERILKFKEVHVIDVDQKSLGNMSTRTALNLAREQELDLYLVSLNVEPPICKIVDYGKMKYNESKQNKASNANKPKQDTKEVKIHPFTQQHDIDFLLKRCVKFLGDGDKVKITCVFKNRELSRPNMGLDKIKSMIDSLVELGTPDNEPVLQGKNMFAVLSPKKR
jgi:translation initiation factor IF-3